MHRPPCLLFRWVGKVLHSLFNAFVYPWLRLFGIVRHKHGSTATEASATSGVGLMPGQDRTLQNVEVMMGGALCPSYMCDRPSSMLFQPAHMPSSQAISVKALEESDFGPLIKKSRMVLRSSTKVARDKEERGDSRGVGSERIETAHESSIKHRRDQSDEVRR